MNPLFYLLLDVSQSQLSEFVGRIIVYLDCSGEEAFSPEDQP